MPDDRNPQLSRDLMDVLAKHGVSALPQGATAAPATRGGASPVASYIKEIITSDQAFDEKMLARVSKVLANADR